MGLFEKIFTKKEATQVYDSYFRLLNAYAPAFHTWQGGIYESELVRAAINARANHMSKLQVSVSGSAKPKLQSRLKQAPNEFQTWGQFLYRLDTILDANNTAVICPVYDQYNDVTGVYPLLASNISIVEYNKIPYLKYMFSNGQTAAIELSKCGIMTKFQFKSDFFGDNNGALRPTMELINIQNQAIQEGAKNAASYKFMAQMSNFAKAEDIARERQKFSRENLASDANGGGLLLFPNTYSNIKQLDQKPFVIDDKQMALIKDNVFDYFGVNNDIIQNKAYGDAWSAFYEGAIEPFAIQLSDVLTKMLFTENEQNQKGAKVIVTSNRLQYMSNADKLNVSAQMADRGLMTRNEIREIWNLPPLEGEIGDSLPVRGEYYDLGDNKDADS